MYVHRNIENSCGDNLNVISRDKKWHPIQNTWNIYNLRPRIEVDVHFRLMTVQDYLGEDLSRIGVFDTNICSIRNNELRPSPGLYRTRQSRRGTGRSP
ncbi:hypothetical protein NPIL_12861 [Nephila pilipes]|uniref:Uncharacterized protein n=1 Tax=Nephila pilipes TaxID=299642 RepID=A0A8X6UBP8_NEPPI|nr:hypothetical protein NPIL_12861 [Nephila pilipes]